MRVLLWQEDNPEVHGGAETWLLDLAKGLRLRGHEAAWLQSAQIERALDAFAPDVVILGTIHNFIGLPAARRLLAHSVPAVWFMHDYWAFCGTRMLMKDLNRSDMGCEANAGTCSNSCGKWHAIPDVVRAIRVVTGCEGAAAILRRHGCEASVVEEGIDTDLFSPSEGERDATVVYASAAGDEVWKGIHILRATGLPVRFLSGLTRPALAAALGTAAVYAFPSVYQETWGLALTEAMACGCAVVASDVAGARAQVVDGVTGLLVPPGDAEVLRAATERLMDDPMLRMRLGTAARAHVVADHSLAAHARRWEALLEGVRGG